MRTAQSGPEALPSLCGNLLKLLFLTVVALPAISGTGLYCTHKINPCSLGLVNSLAPASNRTRVLCVTV